MVLDEILGWETGSWGGCFGWACCIGVLGKEKRENKSYLPLWQREVMDYHWTSYPQLLKCNKRMKDLKQESRELDKSFRKRTIWFASCAELHT